MRSTFSARLREFLLIICAMLLVCCAAVPVALADESDFEIEEGMAAALPLAGELAQTRTYVLPAATLSNFSVANIVSGTVQIAPEGVTDGAEGEEAVEETGSIPTISTTYVAQGCVYVLDRETGEFTLVNAANAELTEEGYLFVPSALLLDDEAHPVTSVAAGALSGTNAVLLALSKNIANVDEDALAGADDLQAVYVSPDNETYSSYDGCLYDSEITSLLLVPEGKLGTVRIPSGVETVHPEAFSHCAFLDAVFADADSAAFRALEDVTLYNADNQPIEVIVIDEDDQMLPDEGTSTGVFIESTVSENFQDDPASVSSTGRDDDVSTEDGSDPSEKSEAIRTPIVYDIAPETVDEMVIELNTLPVSSVVATSDVAEENNVPIFTELVALSNNAVATYADSSIFHMELLPDGSGFMLDYIDSATASGAITIPSVWTQDGQTLPVTAIDSWALCNGYREGPQANNITSIHIPATVVSIGTSMPFGWGGYRQLASVTVDAVNEVFASVDGVLFTKDMTSLIFFPPKSAMTDYSIPASVTNIYNAAFVRCFNLRSVVIPPLLSQNLGNKTFLDACTNVTDIYALGPASEALKTGFFVSMDPTTVTLHLSDWSPEEIALWNKTGIPVANIVQGESPFNFILNSEGTGYELKSVSTMLSGGVTIPSSWTQDGSTLPVTGIGRFAFCGGEQSGTHATKITSVHLPETISSVSKTHAFGWIADMSIAAVTVDEKNPYFTSVNGILYNNDVTTLLFYPFAKTNESYTMPSSLNSYWNAAMTRCKFLRTVTLSASFIEALGSTDAVLMDQCFNMTDIYVDGSTPLTMGGGWFAYMSKDNVKIHLLDYTTAEINTWVNAGFKVGNISKYGSEFTFTETESGDGYILAGVATSASGAVVIPSQWTQGGKTLPVVGIGPRAFSGGSSNLADATNVTSIRIPATVTWISASHPFGWRAGRQLREVEVDLNNPAFCSVDGVLFTKDRTELVFYPPNKAALHYSIPQGTKALRSACFTRCTTVQTITIPSSYSRNLVNTTAFDAVSTVTDIYVEGITAATLGEQFMYNSDKTRVTIHLAHFTPEMVQLWVNAGFLLEKIVPYMVTNSYTVTFDVQGGEPQPTEQKILYGDLVTQPAAPTRTGYDFTGWYAPELERNWNFATDKIDGDTTLIATWRAHEMTLRLDIGEYAELVDPDSGFEIVTTEAGRYIECPLVYDEPFTLPLLERAGHKLLAWIDEAGAAVSDAEGNPLVNGGTVLNVSADEGVTIVYTADWQPVYNVVVPLRVDLAITADFIDQEIKVAPLAEGSASGRFENYSEGEVEVVGMADASDGASAKSLFPNGGHERAFLTVSPQQGEGLVSLGLGRSAQVAKHDEGWAFAFLIPSATSPDGFSEGSSATATPGILEVVYGLDTTTLAPNEMALLDEGTEIARLMYTVQFANPQ